jgi:hypothetical protein
MESDNDEVGGRFEEIKHSEDDEDVRRPDMSELMYRLRPKDDVLYDEYGDEIKRS